MWEIIGDLLGVGVDSGLRAAQVHRAERRLTAGKPVRVPCSARAPQESSFADGGLRFTGGGKAVFEARGQQCRTLAVGGSFRTAEGGNTEWPVATYRPPGGAPTVEFQAHHRYLPLLRRVLARP
ncbi:hypothetical protein [Kitasatospora sp. McL0602]|uniref:hypothetical protein n=1 Tax=Kitasatospora sp. McL0602 TaxID=3439530 RepID=UPI003F8B35F9